MQVRWNMQESEFVLASDMATDRLAANTKVPFGFSVLRVAMWILVAIAIVAAIDMVKFGRPGPGLFVLVFSGVTALLAYFTIQALLTRAAKRAVLRARGPFPIPCALEVHETGLRISQPLSNSEIDWRGVRSVEELPQHISITLGGGGIVLVPNDAFETNERRRELVEVVRQRATSVVPAA
jgi:hypothetical protein